MVLILADCENQSKTFPIDFGRIRLEIETNHHKYTHLDAHEHTLLYFHTGLAIMIFLLFLSKKAQCQKEIEKESADYNWIFIFSNLGIILQLVSYVIELSDLACLAWFGVAVPTFDFFGLFFGFLSQYIVVVILAYLGNGWTLRVYTNEELDRCLPIVVLVAVLVLLLYGVEVLIFETDHKHHKFDSLLMHSAIVSQMIFAIWFVCGMIQMFKLPRMVKKRFKNFLGNLLVFGLFYYLSLPTVMIISVFLDYHYREVFVEICRGVIHSLSLFYLGFMVTNKKGVYKQINVNQVDRFKILYGDELDFTKLGRKE